MLKVPKLDDLTYEQMMQRAVSRIPSMTEEWTDFNHHDPGITVLQMYAWLTDMLDYYMSATGDVHVEKYLKLLGVEPKEGCPAGGYVVLQHCIITLNWDLQAASAVLVHCGIRDFRTTAGNRLKRNCRKRKCG